MKFPARVELQQRHSTSAGCTALLCDSASERHSPCCNYCCRWLFNSVLLGLKSSSASEENEEPASCGKHAGTRKPVRGILPIPEDWEFIRNCSFSDVEPGQILGSVPAPFEFRMALT